MCTLLIRLALLLQHGQHATNFRAGHSFLHGHTPIDGQDDTRDERGLVTRQERDRSRDVLGHAHAPQRDLPLVGLARRVRKTRRHGRLDKSRGYGVAGDVPARELACDRLREADEASLGGRVVDLAGVSHDAHDGYSCGQNRAGPLLAIHYV